MLVTSLLGYGVALVPVVGTAVPLGIDTGRGSIVVAALMLGMALLGVWGIWFVLARDITLVRTPINGPVALVGLAWIVALVSSHAFVDPRLAIRLGVPFLTTQLAALAVTYASLGLLMLAANVGRDLRFARAATWLVIGVGAVVCLASVAGLSSFVAFTNTGGLFTNWVVSLAYGQALFNHRLAAWVRAGLLLLAVAWVTQAAVYGTAWLSGWVPTLAAVLVITLLRSRLLFGALGLVGATVGVAFHERIYQAVFLSQLDEGSDSRLDIWAQAWDLLSQHPLFGTGPVGYAAYYMTFYQGSGSSMSTHSNFIDVAAQTGIVGTLAFLWLLGALAVVATRACRRWRAGFPGGFAAGVSGGYAGAVISMALGDWVMPFIYNQGIGGFRYTVHTWVFLGLLAGLAATPVRASDRG